MYISYDGKAKTNLLDPPFISKIILVQILIEQNNLLCQGVLKQNTHSPCGHLNTPAVCINNNYCSKQVSKDFVDASGHDETQRYLSYRRPPPNSGGATAFWIYCIPGGGSVTEIVDNIWIVPNCPKLSVILQCHLNAVVCIIIVSGMK